MANIPIKSPQTIFQVAYQEDPSENYIPTLGLPTTSADLFKVIDIHEVENQPKLWSFTDIDSAAALGRVIDGPITSGSDLEYAENALQSLLLNDFTNIFIPTIKVSNENGLKTYLRVDKGLRNDASYTAFGKAGAFDYLAAMEHSVVKHGEVTGSIFGKSKLQGMSLDDITSTFSQSFEPTNEFAYALPYAVKASTSFSSPYLKQKIARSHSQFIQSLYQRVRLPWNEFMIPSFELDIKLPPLLSIVLARANNRSDIPDVISDLRQELANSRLELGNITQLLSSTTMHAPDIRALRDKYNKSFDGIVPESLMTDAEKRTRYIKKAYRIFTRLRQLAPMALTELTCDPQAISKAVYNTYNEVRRNSKIVSSSVTATKMSELMRMPNMIELVDTHFSFQERALIHQHATDEIKAGR